MKTKKTTEYKIESNIGKRGYGPSAIKIFVKNRGIVLTEASLILVHKETSKVAAIGNEAERAMESAGDQIAAINPLRRGIIADYMAAVVMFRFLLQKALGCTESHFKKMYYSYLRKPWIAVCLPEPADEVTEVEKKAFEDCFYQVGAGAVMLVTAPLEQAAECLSEKYQVVVGIEWSGSGRDEECF